MQARNNKMGISDLFFRSFAVTAYSDFSKIFGCSIPTANRIKKSGVIAPAITQVARKIVVDVELALELAKKAGDFTSIRK